MAFVQNVRRAADLSARLELGRNFAQESISIALIDRPRELEQHGEFVVVQLHSGEDTGEQLQTGARQVERQTRRDRKGYRLRPVLLGPSGDFVDARRIRPAPRGERSLTFSPIAGKGRRLSVPAAKQGMNRDQLTVARGDRHFARRAA
jgi:hypothetical protein